MTKGRRRKIAVIGGGTGIYTLLSALKLYPVDLTAIVSMADDGGSSGVLRDQYGVLPPGDIRKALVALARSGQTLRELFNYRFVKGDLAGHAFGNLFLTALEKVTGSFEAAVEEAAKILHIKGRVLPATLDDTRLSARLSNGTTIRGETKIDLPSRQNRPPIAKIWLDPPPLINPAARQAISAADIIVIGPGDLYTSIIPNLLVRGARQAIRRSRAAKIYIANLMTKRGETDGFSGEDFLRIIETYLGRGVLDMAIFNSRRPRPAVAGRYAAEGSEFVVPPPSNTSGRPKIILADLIGPGRFVRHEPRKKLAQLILSLLSQHQPPL